MDRGSDRMVALVDYTYAQLVAAQKINASNYVSDCVIKFGMRPLDMTGHGMATTLDVSK